jgi:HK97 family phage portal protein
MDGAETTTGWLTDAVINKRTYAEKTVTVETASGLPVVAGCLKLRCNSVAQMPVKVYARKAGGGRQEAFFDPVWDLLHDQPNPEMVAPDFWGLCETYMSGWGEFFVGKVFNGLGRVAELWPVRADRIRIRRKNGEKFFYMKDATGRENPNPYTVGEMIHVKGFSLNGLRGVSPIGLASEAIAAGLSIQEALGRFYANNSIPRGALRKVDGPLSDEAAKRLQANWNAKYRGTANYGKVAILEEGLDWVALSVPARDAQFVETWQLSGIEIAAIMGVPASLLSMATADKSLTYRTVEGDNLQYLIHGLNPDLVRFETTFGADRDLFPKPIQGPPLYPEFLADAILRADAMTRAKFLMIATGNRAWMRPSEARVRENLPPDDTIDDQPPGTPPPAEPPPPSDG